ncbi:MAG: hypothetical protein EHM91_15855 [Planctomycetota bacterium]|nr:MAG: hypothetical protein EHM91_15855 [Planctomycetota bacterium]
MPTARQTIGAKNLLSAAEQCEPPIPAPMPSDKKREYVDKVQELCELMAAKCQDYRAGRVDDWGVMETLAAYKAALRDYLSGVDA